MNGPDSRKRRIQVITASVLIVAACFCTAAGFSVLTDTETRIARPSAALFESINLLGLAPALLLGGTNAPMRDLGQRVEMRRFARDLLLTSFVCIVISNLSVWWAISQHRTAEMALYVALIAPALLGWIVREALGLIKPKSRY